jgi:hypothetical protein
MSDGGRSNKPSKGSALFGISLARAIVYYLIVVFVLYYANKKLGGDYPQLGTVKKYGGTVAGLVFAGLFFYGFMLTDKDVQYINGDMNSSKYHQFSKSNDISHLW